MSENVPSKQYFETVAGQWDDMRAGYFTPEMRQFVIRKA